MISLMLWRSLRMPNKHPLYLYFYKRVSAHKSVSATVLERINNNVSFALRAIVVAICVFLFSWIFAIAFIVLLPLFIPSIGVYSGLNNAITIGNMIAEERRAGRYPLLSILPFGIEHTYWHVACAVSMSNRSPSRTMETARELLWYWTVGIGLLVFIFPWLVGTDPLNTQIVERIFLILPFIIISIAIIWDFIQSSVIGTLLGMLFSTYTNAQRDAGLLIAGVYLVIQVLFYLLAVVTMIYSYSFFSAHFDFPFRAVVISLALGGLLIVREIGLYFSWRLLAYRLRVDSLQPLFS